MVLCVKLFIASLRNNIDVVLWVLKQQFCLRYKQHSLPNKYNENEYAVKEIKNNNYYNLVQNNSTDSYCHKNVIILWSI